MSDSAGPARVRWADKKVTNYGSWSKGKKMPKSAFPLRGSNSYQLSGQWTWRLITFLIESDEYRVLVAYKEEKQEFKAILGKLEGREVTVLCRVEHHGSHPGWHIHYTPFGTRQTGVMIGADRNRRSCGNGVEFGTKLKSGFESWAISVARKLFQIPAIDDNDDGFLA